MNLILQYQNEITKALGETALLMLISIAAAVLIGLPIGTFMFLSRKNQVLENKVLNTVLNVYVNILRSFPFILLVVVLIPLTRKIVGTSLGTIAASVPMSFIGTAIYARLVEQALIEVPQGILDSAITMGAKPHQIIFKFLFIEARTGLIHGLTSSIISLISYSSVMGVVGGGGIGDFAMRHGYQNHDYNLMYAIIIIMIIFVQIIQFTGNKIATKLDKRHL